MSEPTPVLIHFNQTENAGHTGNWNAAKQAVQNILTMYAAMGLPSLNNANFPILFNNTAEFIFDQITGGDFTISGHAVDKQVAIAILLKPAGYEGLLSAIEALRNMSTKEGFRSTGYGRAAFALESIAQYFKLDNNGVLQFSDKLTADLAGMGKHFARTPKAIAVYTFAQAVVAQYYASGLHQHFSSEEALPDIIQNTIARLKHSDQSFTTDPQEFSTYNRQ